MPYSNDSWGDDQPKYSVFRGNELSLIQSPSENGSILKGKNLLPNSFLLE